MAYKTYSEYDVLLDVVVAVFMLDISLHLWPKVCILCKVLHCFEYTILKMKKSSICYEEKNYCFSNNDSAEHL